MTPASAPPRLDERFALAWAIMDEADGISSSAHRSRGYRVDQKPDLTPVTDVDIRIEQVMLEAIARRFPADGILAEESGGAITPGEQWVIDPLDGTASFIEGLPVFAHMLAKTGGGADFAIVSAPLLGRRWWTYQDAGAYQGDRPVTVSSTDRVEQARICYGGLRDYAEPDAAGLVRLARRCLRSRAFGNFLTAMLVAEGTYDLASIGAGGQPWDIAPLAMIVAAAGGCLTALSGRPWGRREAILVSNGRLHAEAARCIGAAKEAP